MNDPASPDWQLLPADPVAFFQLEDQFDRKQLRRSYSRLIRQFKPETHPQQFQKIREAYELLDSRLRYGHTPDRSVQRSVDLWTTPPAGEPVTATSSAEGTATHRQPGRADAAPQLLERLDDSSPKTLYRELVKQEKRTPRDFFALAVLSDLVDTKEPLMFVRWLLTGLSEHREEPGLLRLLHEYFRTDLPDDAIGKALWATSKVLQGDRYYHLTEPLWDRLLKAKPFSEFAKTLERCESNLRDHRIEGKLAFYIHILRAAAWQADSKWLELRMTWLEEHASEVSGMLEQDLEVTLQICQYRSSSSDFIQGDPVRGLIDQVIRAFCLDEPYEAARKIVEYQDRIGRDALGVMEAFPLGDNSDCQAPLLIYRIAVAETADLVGLDPPVARPQHVEKQAFSLLRDLRDELMTIGQRCAWSSRLIHGGASGALILAPFILLYGFLSGPTLWTLALFWIPAALLGYLFVIRRLWTDKLVERQYYRRFRSAYESSWRSRLYRYCQSTAAPVQVSLNGIIEAAHKGNDEWWIGWLFEFVYEDAGLDVYAAAQPYLR